MFSAILTFLLAACAFTGATFAHFTGGPVALSALLAFLVPAVFVAVIFASRRRQHGVISLMGKLSSLTMGYLNFGFLAALLCWPAAWGVRALGIDWSNATVAWTLMGLAGAVATFGVINGRLVHLTRYTIPLPNLPPTWQGREVAVLSDIHVGIIRGPAFVQHLVDRLRTLDPAAVFIPGDMFDGPEIDIAAAVAPWRELTASIPTYFVTGNHDEFRDPAAYLAALRKVGVHIMHHATVNLRGLQIVGLPDAASDDPQTFRQTLAATGFDRTVPSILLAHRPAHMAIAAEAGISLQLSGHTHAGQFPVWTWIVNRIYGRFAYGLNRVGPLHIVTSSGAGSGGPPLRVGTRSEIVVLRLEDAGPLPTTTAAARAA